MYGVVCNGDLNGWVQSIYDIRSTVVAGMGREGAMTTFLDIACGWIDPSATVPASPFLGLVARVDIIHT